MKERIQPGRIELLDGATVGVIGGGPAGAFFAIQVFRKAKELDRNLKVIVFERGQSPGPRSAPCLTASRSACNYCAGGLSPKLNDVLQGLDLKLPEEIIQSRIHSLTIQGFWKNIQLEVPPGRTLLSVYRGSRPARRGADRYHSFDSFLLAEALRAGADVIPGEVVDVQYAPNGKPLIRYRLGGAETRLEADLAVFAAGVNEQVGGPADQGRMLQSLQRLIPGFVPPRLRRALIFELEAKSGVPENLVGTVHFVEYGSKTLRLEMCSLVPKRGFITVVLVGASVDTASDHAASRDIMAQFLELPHIRRLVSPRIQFSPACVCGPNMVVGSARNPFGDRVAAVGDIVTTRLYKDGILSAQRTARALAETVLELGIDAGSLKQGYGPILRRFRRDNRFASLVFLVNRMFFSSSVLSRVLYQAVITERKTTLSTQRRLEKILWRIASGDDEYEDIFLSMVHPASIWLILTGGALVTLRNYLTELGFGLRWEGIGRFTTGVAKERLEGKRREFSRLLADASVTVPEKLEFERMYTIRIQASCAAILEQLQRFGEAERGYLRPKWVRIQRIAGTPQAPGCVIRYEVVCRHFAFSLLLERVVGERLAVYRVLDGFAQGGMLIFEIEKLTAEVCALSIYVAFNFARGRTWLTRPFWWLFRWLFPAYIHDVLWNHSLCQLKDLLEANPEPGRLGVLRPAPK
jgi:flavin-dependent dehydrogenase